MTRSWIFDTADFFNRLRGPPPGDIVETQGAHLLARPSTPLIHDQRAPSNAPDFLTALDSKLDTLLYCALIRRNQYGAAIADESVEGLTPPEARAEFRLRLDHQRREILRQMDEEDATPTPPTLPGAEEPRNYGNKQVTRGDVMLSLPESVEEKESTLCSPNTQSQRKRKREESAALNDGFAATLPLLNTLSSEPSVSNGLPLPLTTRTFKRKRAFSNLGSNETKKVDSGHEQPRHKSNIIRGVAG